MGMDILLAVFGSISDEPSPLYSHYMKNVGKILHDIPSGWGVYEKTIYVGLVEEMTFAFLLARLIFFQPPAMAWPWQSLRGNQVASSKIWCIPSTWQQSWGQLGAWCFSPMREKTVRPVQKKGVTKFAVAVLEPCPIMFHFLGCQLCLVTWNLVITYYIITVKLSNPRPEALLFLTRGSWNNWVTSQNHPKPWFLHENNDPPFWMMWGSPIFKIPPVSSSALLLVQKMNCWGCGNHQALDKGQRRSRPAPCLIWGS